MQERKTAVVTGANRGIGLEVCRGLAAAGFHVVLTARNKQAGAAALKTLQGDGRSVELCKLDVNSSEDAAALARHLQETRGELQVLVNNAGVLPAKDGALRVAPTLLMETLNTNTLGAVRLIQALAPLMPEGGRIINVSSELGALHDMGGGQLAYRMSKAALNAVTRVFAAELAGDGILVNSMSPGWVQSDMGGAGAPRSLAKGAETILWLATDPKATVSGGFWKDKKQIGW